MRCAGCGPSGCPCGREDDGGAGLGAGVRSELLSLMRKLTPNKEGPSYSSVEAGMSWPLCVECDVPPPLWPMSARSLWDLKFFWGKNCCDDSAE